MQTKTPLKLQGIVALLALFTVLTTLFVLVATAVDAWRERAQVAWPAAAATVERCSVEPYRPIRNGGRAVVWRIECSIRYLADGEEIAAKIRSRSASSATSTRQMSNWVSHHQAGSPIVIHFDPADHQTAILTATDMPFAGPHTLGTPDVDGVEFFDRSTMGMVPLRLDTWGDLIFVNFDKDAEPLAAVLGEIPNQTRGFDFEGLKLAERRDYVIDCNWKVYVDNYLEGYHIPIAHPGLMKEIDYAQYRTDTYRYYSQQFAPIRAMKPDDSGERFYAPGTTGLQEALYFWIFPNLMLNIYPDNLSTNLIVPLSSDKTLTIFEWFFHDTDSPKSKGRIQKAVAFSDEVQQEDILLCENVQKGLKSATYDRGRYSVKRENGVHHFHMLFREFLEK